MSGGNRPMGGQLICIIGPDGVGKTTQAKLLVQELKKRNIKCEYKWLRFRHKVSLPLMALARLMGLSEIKTLGNGVKISCHYYYKSKLVSSLYPIFLYLDTLLAVLINVYIPCKFLKTTIICDRFVYDTLVDLIISTRRFDILNLRIGRRFFSLIPNESKFFLLLAEEDILRNRREDIRLDETLEMKIKIYKTIGERLDIPIISATLSVEKIQEIIVQEIVKKI
jgi:thymidylate kinase